MSFRKRLPMALALFGFTLAARGANAQTLALLTGTKGVDWGNSPHIGSGLHIDQINQTDCIEDPTIRFNLTLGTALTSAFQGYDIEAWVGTSCDNAQARINGQCMIVGQSSIAAHFIEASVQSLLQPLVGGTTDTSVGGTGGTGGSLLTGGTGGSLDVGGTGGTLSTGGTINNGLSEVAGFGAIFGFDDPSGGTGGTAGASTGGDAGTLGAGGVAGTLGAGGMTSAAGMTGASGSGGVAGTDSSAGTGATLGVPSTGGDTSTGTGGDTSTGTGGDTSTGTGGDTSSGTGGDTGTSGTTGVSIPAVCEGDPDLPTPIPRTVYFMLMQEGNLFPGAGGLLKWTFNYDLVGPQAPTNVVAGIGENVLVVNWEEATDIDTDLYQYQLLCDPPPNAPDGTIIGAAGSEGDDASSLPANDQCYTSAFTPGSAITLDTMAAYNCGLAQLTSTNAEAKPLQNYVRYTVAVVAEDQYHNFGPVSNFSCATPEPVTDFYEAYRAAGGKGGGGFCSISSQRSHALTALLLAGSFALVARRRAKRQGQRRNRA